MSQLDKEYSRIDFLPQAARVVSAQYNAQRDKVLNQAHFLDNKNPEDMSIPFWSSKTDIFIIKINKKE